MSFYKRFRGTIGPVNDPANGLDRLREIGSRTGFFNAVNPLIERASRYTLRGSRAVKLAEQYQADGRTWEHNGIEHGVLRYDIGNTHSNPIIVTPETVRKAIAIMAETERIPYTPSSGTHPLKQALSNAYGVPCDEIYVVNGVTEAVGVTALLFSNSGGEIVLPTPIYPPWAGILLLHGVEIKPALRQGSGILDIKSVGTALGPKSIGSVIITAGNPDGLFMDIKTAEGMAAVLHSNMVEHGRLQFLVVDDIYLEQIPKEQRIDYFAISERYGIPLIYLGGIDKTLGTGLHGGHMILHVPEALEGIRSEIYDRMDTIFAMYLGANALTQRAMLTYLNEYETVHSEFDPNFERFRTWSARFSDGLRKTNGVGYYYREPDLGLYHLLRLPPGIDSEIFAAKMVEQHGVCVSPGTPFGVADGIRVAMVRDPMTPVE
ncbi:MAG: pyridoxal phosphate-dependent aminotransferase, partial [Candidatus Micrarchaeia archaeon]